MIFFFIFVFDIYSKMLTCLKGLAQRKENKRNAYQNAIFPSVASLNKLLMLFTLAKDN